MPRRSLDDVFADVARAQQQAEPVQPEPAAEPQQPAPLSEAAALAEQAARIRLDLGATSAEVVQIPVRGPAVVVADGRTAAVTGQVTAMSDVLAAYKSAQTSPGEWVAFSMRLPAAVDARIKARLVVDSAATGLRRLGGNHYVQAALSRLPDDLTQAADVGRAWRDAHVLAASGGPSGANTRLHGAMADRMHLLGRQLRTLPGAVRLQDVAAGAVSALLDELDRGPQS